MSIPSRRRSPVLAVLLALAILAAACGSSDQPDSVAWRNVELDLPDGWYLFEEEADRLSFSNQDIGIGDVIGTPTDRPDGEVVAMFFTYEPETVPDDWRDLLERLDAEVETDAQLVLRGDVPATQLIYRYETEGVMTREMVVVIPSRSIVLLAQPVPAPGDTDVGELFLRYLDDMMGVLETAEFGAPVLD
ncbi:MAG: hypothetical protein ACLFS9_10940 [Nitriliruptoraceae bacterium]